MKKDYHATLLTTIMNSIFSFDQNIYTLISVSFPFFLSVCLASVLLPSPSLSIYYRTVPGAVLRILLPPHLIFHQPISPSAIKIRHQLLEKGNETSKKSCNTHRGYLFILNQQIHQEKLEGSLPYLMSCFLRDCYLCRLSQPFCSGQSQASR